MANPTWPTRELPILEAVAAAEAKDEDVDSDALADATGLSTKQVNEGLKALFGAFPPYLEAIDASSMGGDHFMRVTLLERGRREVGAWPSEENALDGFLELLTARIEAEDNEDEKSRLEELREAARDVGAPVLSGLLLTYVKSWVGMACWDRGERDRRRSMRSRRRSKVPGCGSKSPSTIRFPEKLSK